MYKKSKKRIHTRRNFVVVFASKFKCINLHATLGTVGDICTSSVTRYATCKEEYGAAGSTFDGGWGTSWWQDVDGGAENKEWVVGVGEDGKVGEHGDATVEIEVECLMVVGTLFEMTAEYRLNNQVELN